MAGATKFPTAFLSDEIAQNRVSGMIVPSIFLGCRCFPDSYRPFPFDHHATRANRSIEGLRLQQSGDRFSLPEVCHGGDFRRVLARNSLLGLWLGSLIAEMYQQFYRFPVFYSRIRPDLLILVIFISFAAAGLGAILSVRKVVSLPPAEAMRPEPPARFHAGFD